MLMFILRLHIFETYFDKIEGSYGVLRNTPHTHPARTIDAVFKTLMGRISVLVLVNKTGEFFAL